MRASVLLTLLCASCVSEATCQERIDAAIALARDHLVDCTLDVDALAEPSCAADDRPELSYLATWCSEADLSCVTADDATRTLCFGEP